MLDSRISDLGKRLQYLVFWEGYEADQNSWKPAGNLKNAPDAIKEFHRLHPHAPGPITRT